MLFLCGEEAGEAAWLRGRPCKVAGRVIGNVVVGGMLLLGLVACAVSGPSQWRIGLVLLTLVVTLA